MTAIRVPIVVSVGLHGLVLIILGLIPFVATVIVKHRQEITVELVEMAPAVVEQVRAFEEVQNIASPDVPGAAAQNSERTPLARPQTVRRHLSRHVPVPKSINPVAPHAAPARNVGATSPRPVPSAPAPEFILVPRGSAPTASLVSTAASPVLSLGADVPSISLFQPVLSPSRPLLASTSLPSRILRDPAAELGEAQRSKVRVGSNPRPEYPRLAREAGWEGTVMLRIEVLPDGRAGTVTVQSTSGFSVLDEAAIIAVQHWQFTPAMDGSFPLRSVVHLPVKFDLRAP